MPEPDRHDWIELTRRVDWRFLLPEPELGRVAYLGRPDPLLERACAGLARSFHALDPRETGFDVVVLVRPTEHELATAASGARPGGCIYVETSGFRAHRSLKALARLGFEDAAVHWHRPSFDRCEEIVPLEENAVRHVLAQRRGGSPAKAMVGEVLLRAKVLRFAIPCASVVATSPGAAS